MLCTIGSHGLGECDSGVSVLLAGGGLAVSPGSVGVAVTQAKNSLIGRSGRPRATYHAKQFAK